MKKPGDTSMRVPLAAFLFIVALSALGAAREKSDLGDKIIAFCKENKGKCVGGGECAHLAEQALRAVGGRRRGPDSPNPGDYTWGDLVYTLERVGGKVKATGRIKDVRPGDLIQLREARWFKTLASGGYSTFYYPHHTAVVAAVDKSGKSIKIFHQNVNGKRFVVDGRISLTGLREGWLRIYHPLPRGSEVDDVRPDWARRLRSLNRTSPGAKPAGPETSAAAKTPETGSP